MKKMRQTASSMNTDDKLDENKIDVVDNETKREYSIFKSLKHCMNCMQKNQQDRKNSEMKLESFEHPVQLLNTKNSISQQNCQESICEQNFAFTTKKIKEKKQNIFQKRNKVIAIQFETVGTPTQYKTQENLLSSQSQTEKQPLETALTPIPLQAEVLFTFDQ